MKMTQIVSAVATLLDAATSTHLSTALVYHYDFATDADPDLEKWEVRVIPFAGKEGSEYMGDTGWRAGNRVCIEARKPCVRETLTDLKSAALIVEEIIQVIADNRELTISGETEAASMSGGTVANEPMQWDYGSLAQGNVSYTAAHVYATWEGPQIAPT